MLQVRSTKQRNPHTLRLLWKTAPLSPLTGAPCLIGNPMPRKPVNPLLVCADGFSMSVQASARHFCEPRTNWGPYTQMEVGNASPEEPLLLPFQDEPYFSPDRYDNVPVEVIHKIIAKHGGLVKGHLPHTLIEAVSA